MARSFSRRGRRKSKKPGGRSTANPETKSIAITRPVGKGRDTAEYVRSLGWTPFIFHTVELNPLDDQTIRTQLRSCLNQGPVDWIVFMSSSGVKLLFDSFNSQPSLRKGLANAKFLAVGPRTREALMQFNETQVSIPEKYDSNGVNEFFSRREPTSLRIVLIRSSSADDSLSRSLKSRGASVATIRVYESGLPRDLQTTFDFLENLASHRFGAVLFTSAISVSNLFKIAKTRFGQNRLAGLLKKTRVGAIGPATATELHTRGIEPILPDEYLIENAVKKLTIM